MEGEVQREEMMLLDVCVGHRNMNCTRVFVSKGVPGDMVTLGFAEGPTECWKLLHKNSFCLCPSLGNVIRIG